MYIANKIPKMKHSSKNCQFVKNLIKVLIIRIDQQEQKLHEEPNYGETEKQFKAVQP